MTIDFGFSLFSWSALLEIIVFNFYPRVMGYVLLFTLIWNIEETEASQGEWLIQSLTASSICWIPEVWGP